MTSTTQEAGGPSEKPVESRVTEMWSRLTRAERVVARHLAGLASQDVMIATADALAASTDTSDATVVRTVKKLGYDGLPALKLAASETLRKQQLPHIQRRIELSSGEHGIPSILDTIQTELSTYARETFELADIGAYESAVDALARAADVSCYAWGLSQLGADYLRMRLGRMGKSARLMNANGFGLAEQLIPIHAHSAVVIFAPGRHLPDIDLIIRHARAVGASIILITSSLTELSEKADFTLLIASSKSGVLAEPIAEMICADILLLALVAHMPEQSMQTYDLLRRLRVEALEGTEN